MNDPIDTFVTPVDYRQLRYLLDCHAQSEQIIAGLRRQLQDFSNRASGCICVFGSLARREMDSEASDVDLMFIGHSRAERARALRQLIRHNRSLDFHVPPKVLAALTRSTAATLELRAPVIAPALLRDSSENAVVRRVQFLTEASWLSDESVFDQMTTVAIKYYDLEPKDAQHQRPERFIRDLERYYAVVESTSMARTDKNTEFVAKYLIIREMWRAVTAMGIVEAVLRRRQVLESTTPAVTFANILRQSLRDKLLFWGSQAYFGSHSMALLRNHEADATKAIAAALDASGVSESVRVTKRTIELMLAALALATTKAYSDAICHLNEPGLRPHLAELPGNFISWRKDPALQQIIHMCERTTRLMRAIALSVDALFTIVDGLGAFGKPYRGSGLRTAVEFMLKECG